MIKNTAGQGVYLRAIDTDGAAVTTDIGAQITKDGGAASSVIATGTHIGNGIWWFDLSQAETNADMIAVWPESTASPAEDLMPDPVIIQTIDVTVGSRAAESSLPTNFSALGINASGHVSRVTLVDTSTANTDMRGTDNASTHSAADVWAVSTRTLSSFGTLVADVSSAVWGAAARTLTAFGFTVETDTASRNASKADVSGLLTSTAFDTRLSSTRAGYIDNLNTLTENVSGLRFTEKALEQAPAGEGGGDSVWSTGQRDQVLTDAAAAKSAAEALPSASDINITLTAAHGEGPWTSAALGAGDTLFEYTVLDAVDSTPLSGVRVYVSTDEGRENIVAYGLTDDFGKVQFMLDQGTYYFWKRLAGYEFTDFPDIETVV